ncbi:hypothetical protein [Micromonospora zhanjiangensis]|uniref:SUKH-3 immunity protein n=1 Tax=Micromonospora zhanjiangensis TaxID=1522057 RepID=A0ABV8KGM6_9ACTN
MTELWNWRVDGDVDPAEIYQALADVLGRPVLALGAYRPIRPIGGTVLCDVWRRPGDFPVSVDCYGPPGLPEGSAVAAFAHRLGRSCLLPDDTLDGGRYLLVDPDGTMRPVHFDVRDTDEGEVLSGRRLCTRVSPRCRGWSPCHQSRWAPDQVVPALAAA